MKPEESRQLILVGPILKQPIQSTDLKILSLEDAPQIGVDGGVSYASSPVFWVGDGDSAVLPSAKIPYIEKKTQDQTDLKYTLEQIAFWKWTSLHLFGFLGKRKDHEWANLGEVCHELKRRASQTGAMASAVFYDLDFRPRVRLFAPGSYRVGVTGLFSLLCFERATVSLEGNCEYRLQNEILEPFSGRGVSNRGSGLIRFESTAPVMIILEQDEENP